MYFGQSEQWMQDLDTVIRNSNVLSLLRGKTIFITGASGLIGSSIVDLILRFNDTCDGGIHVIAAGRDRSRIYERFGIEEERSDFSFLQYDAADNGGELYFTADYVIHGASNASPEKYIREPVETMMSNIGGLFRLLKVSKDNGCSRVLFISSSEVYGKNESNKPFGEDQYGYIDILSERSSYPIGKRSAETLCVSFAREYGVETVIVRPGHIYGPTASKNDNRVSSRWPYAVANGEDIVMKSDGAQLRSYCYCLDCASAILTALINGENCHAYNVSNPNSVITIKQMAEILTKSADVHLKMEIPTEEERRGFNPMNNSSLDGTSLLKLGLRCCFDAETGFDHTVRIIKERSLNE